MSITVGFVKSDTQINVANIDLKGQTVSQKLIDAIELKDTNFQLLITNDAESMDELEESFNSEKKFYPIISNTQFGLNNEKFSKLGFEELVELYTKVNARWILSNNIKTIEQIYSIISYLKDLWLNDRNAFFEELWFIMKTNLATSELTMIFHDVEGTDEDEKNKPQLVNAVIGGNKIPNITSADDSQNQLMKEYSGHFNEIFQVTEFSAQKGELVATAHVNLSPILIMGKTSSLNQLQNSILIAIFSGLQTDS